MNRSHKAFVAVAILMGISSILGCGATTPTGPRAAQTSPYTLHTVAGYVVPWDARSVAATAQGALTEVSPDWYVPTESGQVVFASQDAQQSQSQTEALASSHHVLIVPTIANYVGDTWDGRLIHHLITDPQARAAHLAAIVELARSHQWAGIDLDYESLRAADRAAYSAFIHDLAAALHRVQKRLTLTVHAKTAEPGDWSGARAQDWRALGASADEVRVMAYDYSTDTSPPGAIAPVAWVQSVLQLAVAEVPRAKIVLGLATYGYDWMSGEQAQDLQWADAEALAQAHSAKVMWDPTSASPWFAYTDAGGHPHTVWYENARSLQAKLDLALRYRIGGVVLWRLGGEDPAIWELLRQAT